MSRRIIGFLLYTCILVESIAAAPRGCVASVSLGTFELSVQSQTGGEPRPVKQQNIISPGQKLTYKPVQIPSDLKDARMCLILVPAEISESTPITVLEPVDAQKPSEWTAPFRVSVVGLVFGPQGLDRKKVSKLVAKDQELIAQLADYAEQTSQVETLIETLRAAEEGPSRSKNLEAALSGFASRFGTSMTKLDTTAPTDQQAAILLRTLNPAIASYDPLSAPSASSRMQQSAGLAASVAGLFFGSTVGLAAGGAAMATNMRTILFPDTDFRSALVQTADSDMTMCAKRQPQRSRTRLAYLWAHRVPNVGAPSLALAGDAHVPLGAKSALAFRPGPGLKYVDRAREWKLVSTESQSTVPLEVKPGAQGLEIDLSRADAKPGLYRLAAKWDWDAFDVAGTVNIHALSDLKDAVVTPESQDRLVQDAGPVQVTLSGADFQFIEKVSLKDGGDLEFKLPSGKRAGPQQTIDVQVDASKLQPGMHRLVLSQPNGAQHEVAFRLLPPNPRIENFPVRVNLGEKEQTVTIRGSGLDRVEEITCDGASVKLGPVQNKETRNITVRLGQGLERGDRLPVSLKVEGMHQPVRVPDVLDIAAPRPRIDVVKGSWPDELGVMVREGELPAGSFVSFSMKVENAEGQPSMRLECAERDKTLQALTLKPGAKHSSARFESAGRNVLFVSLDPAGLAQTGCSLTAVIETEGIGASDPYPLGKVIRLPRIEGFTLTDEKIGESMYAGTLTGQDLETIERVGWTAEQGVPVDDLPKSVAGGGQKQILRVALSWPSPAPRAPVYVWLRGEKEGRATKARY